MNAFYSLVWDSLRLAPITDNVYAPCMTSKVDYIDTKSTCYYHTYNREDLNHQENTCKGVPCYPQSHDYFHESTLNAVVVTLQMFPGLLIACQMPTRLSNAQHQNKPLIVVKEATI